MSISVDPSSVNPGSTAPIDDHDAGAVAQIMYSFAHEPMSFNEAATRLDALLGTQESDKKLRSFLENQLSAATRIKPGMRRAAIRWSPDDDAKLIAAVQLHGTDNWGRVAQAVGGRTRGQCSQRWNRGLDPKLNKENWCEEEEQKLIDAVGIHGTKAWIKVAAEMGNRSDVQCRFRYLFLCKKAEEARTQVHPVSPRRAVLVAARDQKATDLT
jgi:hypothetical protein